MNLPSPIRTYFDADGRLDGNAPMSAFAPDATVVDEGHAYRGLEAIETWWRKAKAKSQYIARPIAITGQDEVTEVRATVSGSFPGSPADLTFAFRLKDGLIVDLRIGA